MKVFKVSKFQNIHVTHTKDPKKLYESSPQIQPKNREREREETFKGIERGSDGAKIWDDSTIRIHVRNRRMIEAKGEIQLKIHYQLDCFAVELFATRIVLLFPTCWDDTSPHTSELSQSR